MSRLFCGCRMIYLRWAALGDTSTSVVLGWVRLFGLGRVERHSESAYCALGWVGSGPERLCWLREGCRRRLGIQCRLLGIYDVDLTSVLRCSLTVWVGFSTWVWIPIWGGFSTWGHWMWGFVMNSGLSEGLWVTIWGFELTWVFWGWAGPL